MCGTTSSIYSWVCTLHLQQWFTERLASTLWYKDMAYTLYKTHGTEPRLLQWRSLFNLLS